MCFTTTLPLSKIYLNLPSFKIVIQNLFEYPLCAPLWQLLLLESTGDPGGSVLGLTGMHHVRARDAFP